MAIDIHQERKQQEETRTETIQVQPDGWSKAFDDIIHYDFSGVSTLIVVLLIIILIKPILFILKYAVAGFIIFMFVKYFLYYAN